MPKPIIWSPLSENDFENILDYLDNNFGNKVAFNFVEQEVCTSRSSIASALC